MFTERQDTLGGYWFGFSESKPQWKDWWVNIESENIARRVELINSVNVPESIYIVRKNSQHIYHCICWILLMQMLYISKRCSFCCLGNVLAFRCKSERSFSWTGSSECHSAAFLSHQMSMNAVRWKDSLWWSPVSLSYAVQSAIFLTWVGLISSPHELWHSHVSSQEKQKTVCCIRAGLLL